MLKVKGLSVIHYLIMFPMIQRQRCHALPHRCRLANRNHHLATNSTRELRSSAHFLNLFCHHESSTIGLSSWLLEFILSIIWPVKRLIWNEYLVGEKSVSQNLAAKINEWQREAKTHGGEGAPRDPSIYLIGCDIRPAGKSNLSGGQLLGFVPITWN